MSVAFEKSELVSAKYSEAVIESIVRLPSISLITASTVSPVIFSIKSFANSVQTTSS